MLSEELSSELRISLRSLAAFYRLFAAAINSADLLAAAIDSSFKARDRS